MMIRFLNFRRGRLVVLATAACTTILVHADEVVLDSGARLRGGVATNDETPRSQLAIESAYGKLVLPRDRVSRVINESPGEAEYRRRAPSVSDTVEAQMALAMWCRDNGVRDGMRRHLQRVLELAPDHAEARTLLGFQQVDGRWMTRDDVLAARGLVRWQGEYRTRQEVALLKHEECQEAEALAWRRQLASWRDDLVGRDGEAARIAEEAFENLTDPAVTTELLSLLAEEKNPAVRRLLIRATGRLGTPDCLSALVSVALGDIDDELRAEALDLLVADGRPGLTVPFVNALRSDDPRIINNAGHALGRLGSIAIVDPLIDALVTTHRRKVGNDSGGQSYSLNTASGTTSFGGGGPRIIKQQSRNARVLESLVSLTGENYLYDEEAWRRWLAGQQTQVAYDLRRDL
ncbi:MAG: HEAT repeat domain-containing protein [Planctomycetota bacterium]